MYMPKESKMISKVTVCPLEDPEHLVQCAEIGKEPIAAQIAEIIETLKTNSPDMQKRIDLLDLLYHAATSAAQMATIKSAVCTFCDHSTQCHPTT